MKINEMEALVGVTKRTSASMKSKGFSHPGAIVKMVTGNMERQR